MTIITVSSTFDDIRQRNEHVNVTAEMVQDSWSNLPYHIGMSVPCFGVINYNFPELFHK